LVVTLSFTEAEMARTQKNKATAKHLGLLKAKVSKLKAEINGIGAKVCLNEAAAPVSIAHACCTSHHRVPAANQVMASMLQRCE
jgi:hypothetical protein